MTMTITKTERKREKPRRAVIAPELAVDQKERLRQYTLEQGGWPLDAPCMPGPGPDFLEAVGLNEKGHFLQDEDGQAIEPGHEGDDVTFWLKTKTSVRFIPGKPLIDYYLKALRQPGTTLPVRGKEGRCETVSFIPGHIWSDKLKEWRDSLVNWRLPTPLVCGPQPADVFVLGKMPWKDECAALRNLVGGTGEVLVDTIRRMGIKGAGNWYIANLVKFMPPGGDRDLRATWIKDCLPLLYMELCLVRPKYVLCLGADAIKTLMDSNNYTITGMDGRVEEKRIRVDTGAPGESPAWHTMKVMAVLHPAVVASDRTLQRVLDRGIGRFGGLIKGEVYNNDEPDKTHLAIRTLEEAEELVERMEKHFADKTSAEKLVAWDAEWHGNHPYNRRQTDAEGNKHNEDSYLRCVQCAWAPKHAAVFILTEKGGKKCFRDKKGKLAHKRLAALLKHFMRDKRVVGQYFISDLMWLIPWGLDLRDRYFVPLDDAPDGRKAWERLRDGEGGFDTMGAGHSIEETAMLGLESLTMRYTNCPRYDVALDEWKKEFCKQRGIPQKALEGYGECPDKILYPWVLNKNGEREYTSMPYTTYDADAPLRLAHTQMKLLSHDYDGNDCWESFWEFMITLPVILEMQMNGVLVDKERVRNFSKAFLAARDAAQERVRKLACWPTLNVRSVEQVREFLFGEELNGKVRQVSHEAIRIRPPKGLTLNLKPILDTSEPQKTWAELERNRDTQGHNPSTGKLSLSILAQDHPNFGDEIGGIRDFRFLDQVVKQVLRPPKEEGHGRWISVDTEESGGVELYDSGLMHSIDDDGRVRTHYSPVQETGRWSSFRPNLSNLGKRRDNVYKRLLGDAYEHKLRSILMPPPGRAFVEFDLMAAELAMAAIYSGDELMLEHIRRNQLPEDHPDFFDMHASRAVQVFKLACAPRKKDMDTAGVLRFRDLAKIVNFRIMYGGGAKATALGAREEGVKTSKEEVQTIMDDIYRDYPNLLEFFIETEEFALKNGWIKHGFGRYRRFPEARDRGSEGNIRREARNFPEQSPVASVIDRGLARLQWARDNMLKRPDLFTFALQLHDAGLIDAPYKYVEYLVEELIPWAISKCVPIYPTRLDGTPTGRGPYYLGVEVTVYKHWGERFTKEECRELGMPERYGVTPKKA